MTVCLFCAHGIGRKTQVQTQLLPMPPPVQIACISLRACQSVALGVA